MQSEGRKETKPSNVVSETESARRQRYGGCGRDSRGGKPAEFSEEGAIWARKLDGAAIDKEKKIRYVLEFKRTTDQREEYEEGARVRAERQYEDLVQGLLRVGRKQGQGWTEKQITFVRVGDCDEL